MEEATVRLREAEVVGREGDGEDAVTWYGVRYASNSPIEDDWIRTHIDMPIQEDGEGENGKIVERIGFWGIFDGHAYVLPFSLSLVFVLLQLFSLCLGGV